MKTEIPEPVMDTEDNPYWKWAWKQGGQFPRRPYPKMVLLAIAFLVDERGKWHGCPCILKRMVGINQHKLDLALTQLADANLMLWSVNVHQPRHCQVIYRLTMEQQ